MSVVLSMSAKSWACCLLSYSLLHFPCAILSISVPSQLCSCAQNCICHKKKQQHKTATFISQLQLPDATLCCSSAEENTADYEFIFLISLHFVSFSYKNFKL